MTRMWVFTANVGWWKAHGWKELLGKRVNQGVEEVLLEHEEDIDVEKAFYGEEEEED